MSIFANLLRANCESCTNLMETDSVGFPEQNGIQFHDVISTEIWLNGVPRARDTPRATSRKPCKCNVGCYYNSKWYRVCSDRQVSHIAYFNVHQ